MGNDFMKPKHNKRYKITCLLFRPCIKKSCGSKIMKNRLL